MRTLHIGLRVSDIEKSRTFYTHLGYRVLGEVPGTGLGNLTMLNLPDDEFVSLELVHDPDGGAVTPAGINHVVIKVESMHDFVKAIRAKGIEVGSPDSPDGSDDFWVAWLTDPDGYRIELVQWPTGHPDGMTEEDLAGEASHDES